MSEITDNIHAVCELIAQPGRVGAGVKHNPLSIQLNDKLSLLKSQIETAKLFPDDWTYKHSVGQGRGAEVVWIACLPPQQKVKDGIYVVFCFGKSGNGFVLGCAVSKENKSKYAHVPTQSRSNLEIDVVKYNDVFVNPMDVALGNVNEEQIKAHLKESIKKCQDYLNITPSSIAANKGAATGALPIEPFDQSALKAFQNAVRDSGLQYDDIMEKRFIAALGAKSFVVLTGLSGSGKTKLAQAFVKWIAIKDSSLLIPVGADWTNSEKLLGYPNALDKTSYVMPDTGVLKLLMDSEKNPKLPFFLILDEMNLSHVERYFADFLSAMESGDEIKLYDGDQRYADEAKTIAVPKRIRVPKNLFVIGTMNVDETTYMFSPKVLDRAQVIEFRVKPDEMAKFAGHWEDGDGKIVAPETPGATWKTGTATKIDLDKLADPNGIGKGAKYAESFLELALKRGEKKPSGAAVPAAPAGQPVNPDAGKVPLQEVAKAVNVFFKPLAELGAEFGYRSAAEIMSFCGFYIDAGAKIDDAIDAAIVQKLLPKVHGSRRKLERVLTELWKLCRMDGVTDDLDAVAKTGGEYDFSAKTKYPLSAEKVLRMFRAAMANGFASFAEA